MDQRKKNHQGSYKIFGDERKGKEKRTRKKRQLKPLRDEQKQC